MMIVNVIIMMSWWLGYNGLSNTIYLWRAGVVKKHSNVQVIMMYDDDPLMIIRWSIVMMMAMLWGFK